jgi:competence protein ComEC
VSLLANLVVVPLSSLALMCNLGSLLAGDWLHYVTELFNHSGWFFMAGMVALSEWFARLPGAYWHVPASSWAGFLLYYAALAILFSGWLLRAERRWIAIGILVLLAGTSLAMWKQRQDATRITILAAGSGDAILTDLPGGRHDLLIDAGDRSLERFVVSPYLYSRGINHLPRLVLTHGDVRHVGGASEVASAFNVNEVFTSDLPFRSPPYRALTRTLDQTPGRRHLVHRGDSIGPWRLLHPAAGDRPGQADDGAMVLAGSFEGISILLCSDLGRLGQRALHDSGEDLRADVLVTGIPAQSEPLNDALLEKIKPRAIIVSCGEYPASERATPALRERLARGGVPVFFTENEGSVTLDFKPGRCEVRAMNGRRLVLEPAKR